MVRQSLLQHNLFGWEDPLRFSSQREFAMSQDESAIASDLSASKLNSLPAETQPGSASSVFPVLVMVAGGFVTGMAVWLVLEVGFPLFSVSEEIRDKIPLSFPSRDVLQEFAAAKRSVELQNSMAAGMVMGVLAGAVFSVLQSAFRRADRLITKVLFCAAWSGAMGLAAAWVGQTLAVHGRDLASDESILRTMLVHACYWAVLGGAVGMRLALPSRGLRDGSRLVCQGISAGVLTALIYVPFAGSVFPLDDAERLLPASPLNRGFWVIAGMLILGALLGTASGRRANVQTGAATEPSSAGSSRARGASIAFAPARLCATRSS
jgi:hypothetical protein